MSRPRDPARPVARLAAAVVLALGSGPLSAQVEVRGRAQPLEGIVAAVTPEGVFVRTDASTATLVAWDAVRRVLGPESRLAQDHAHLAEALFRGRTRLERGDTAGAAEVLEPLFALARSAPDPAPDAVAPKPPAGVSAALLAEGVLRVRLSRNATVNAIEPYLAWVAARRSPTSGPNPLGSPNRQVIGGVIALSPVFDAGRQVAPRVAPMFSMSLSAAALRAAAQASAPLTIAPGDSVSADLAAIYRAAIAAEVALADGLDPVLPRTTSADDAVQLAGEIVTARAGDATQRRLAREQLQKRLAAALAARASAQRSLESEGFAEPLDEAWLEAWCSAAIGRSLVREPDAARVREGVLSLLAVPARFGENLPELSRLALADARDALARAGDDPASAILHAELLRLADLVDDASAIERLAPDPPASPDASSPSPEPSDDDPPRPAATPAP